MAKTKKAGEKKITGEQINRRNDKKKESMRKLRNAIKSDPEM